MSVHDDHDEIVLSMCVPCIENKQKIECMYCSNTYYMKAIEIIRRKNKISNEEKVVKEES